MDGGTDACISGAEPDQIDGIVEQWQSERPDLDLSAMGMFARMKMFVTGLTASMEGELDKHGLTPGEFDVLATLRRTGPPCVLIPSQLSASLMMSRAGITNRLDRLEAAGLVKRNLDPDDRRSFRVGLTDKGLAVIDAALTGHAANIARLANHLTAEQREHFDQALRVLLRAL
ncbi:MarR family transcriptional regulator [Parafrankia sp. FMc6]|uniref:MarR family winged helix-turn-helix transcriptional regulator n=1 Tax=Parafrankia soli TaxID=2599596 RepID=UPI0034D74C88